MDLHKILLKLSIITMILSITACSTSVKYSSIFPRNEKGYPKANCLIINKTVYTIGDTSLNYFDQKKYEVNISSESLKNNTLTVVLPGMYAINTWVISDSNDYKVINTDIEECYIKGVVPEGPSPDLQIFKIEISDNCQSISFKWTNVNYMNEDFEQIEEDSLLLINID
ncbi:hypothetical protein [Lachnospira multipara]|uniref:Lipoprotein n=1 Tax=Lachnospira multipara TaxID=28051 RepID=A0A1H5V3G8_9FIRM|nr:hypothetical protein [Lachnospira multipara]SEF81746.1 hypothetical protein SAMN05216537_10996 [Lachnospira multipara]